jgi:phytoene dehydrogenase-like protein
MLKSDNDMYDVIVIGAGISGLVSGCSLAKAGLKVLIVEQHNKPGGYFTSFKRRGFQFDSAAHSFGNYRESGHVKKIFSDLGVDKIVGINRFDPSDVIISPDFRITFWNDANKTIKDLAKIFPNEKDNIVNFFKFLLSANQTEFTKLKDKTFSQLLHSFFQDEKLISSLSLFAFGNGGLPPSLMHAFSGAKIFSEFIIDGGYYPEGGIQNLPNALEQIIRQHEGKVLYKKTVSKILVESNNVVGVVLNGKERLLCHYVIAACDMTQTFTVLLNEELVGKERIDKLKEFSPSISTFILYIGIDKPFRGLPQPGTNTWYLPHYDLDAVYNHIQQCNLAEAGIYMVRVSPDQRTLLALVSAPYKTALFWKQNKKKIAEDFLLRIEKVVPDLKQHVTYYEAATPLTSYRYTLNYQGAAFGWAKTPTQTYDPLFNRTTFINGLYLTGHWTSIAFGMPGVCYSGADTAARILKKIQAPTPQSNK